MPSTVEAPAAPLPPALRFGTPTGPRRFELQPGERRLLVDGQPAPLGARALDVLIVLASRPEHLVTKNELLDLAWPGVVVEEANLHVQISHLRKLLGGDVICTVPGRGYRFVALVEAVAEAATAAPPAAQSAVPAAPRLVGRDADLTRLEALLGKRSGCVTLVGTSGVGKTTLARAAAARWPGRSVWLDLATLAQGSLVAGSLARALGAPLREGEAPAQLLRTLQGQALLLVLDNAEHLIDACAELATLLCALPDVQLLVTSQLPLAVAGEQVQRLEPLALPSAAAGGRGDGALALLVERIVAADHRFVPGPSTLPLLHTICSQLDGLPLALEMAAARVPLIGLKGVSEALAQRFSLLTRGHRDAAERHRTLHNALDWSYRLLAAPEQRLFRALGVFCGGFTLELAVALITDGAAVDAPARWDVIDRLATLVDRSLVVASADDPPRYRLLETLRAYALEQLSSPAESAKPGDSGAEAAATYSRHATATLALFEERAPLDVALQARREAEMENARAAVAWASANDLAVAARLTAAVAAVAVFTVWRNEATNWLEALEPAMLQAAGLTLPAQVQAVWWTEMARMSLLRGDPRALPLSRRAVALWRPLQQPRQLLFATVVWLRSIPDAVPELDQACAALQALAATLPDLSPRERLIVHGALVGAHLARNDYEAVLAGRLAEIELATELGWPHGVEAAGSNVVGALIQLGRYSEAAQRAQALLRRIDAASGDANGNLPWVFRGLVEALVKQGRLDEAQALVPRAMAACERFNAPLMMPLAALLLAKQQRCPAAAQLIGRTLQDYDALGRAAPADAQALLAAAQTLVDAALAPAQVQALIREGRQLDPAQAAAIAAGHR